MAAFSGRLPTLRLPRLAVGGSARVRAALGLAAVFVLLLLLYWFYQRPTSPASTVTPTPGLDPKPGDANNNDYLRGLAIDKSHRDADAARAAGQTTTPDMRAADSMPNVQPPAVVSPQAQTKAPAASAAAPAFNAGQQGGQHNDKEDQAAKEAQRAYREAMVALMASWGSKASARSVEITPEEMAKRLEQAQQAA